MSLSNRKKFFLKSAIVVGILSFVIVLYFFYLFFAPNISTKSGKETYLYIYPESSLETVIDSIEVNASIKSKATFKQAARMLKYTNIRTGKYKIPNGISNYRLIKRLRNKEQMPVKVTFNNIRTKEQLAGRLSSLLMPDSTSIINLLNDRFFLSAYGLTPGIAVIYFIPNTYELFWDTDAEKLFGRMEYEYNKFWTDERKAKAAAIPLTETEVSILASIVEEETNKSAERPIVAGLYINRLRKGMPLQADPTVKFAINDFGIQRVLLKHLEVDSPYNTYKYTGLPPGPIRTPSINSIDAVLNYKTHNYIYMCAKETLNGEHNFAVTLSEHLNNAAKYQKALNQMRIFK